MNLPPKFIKLTRFLSWIFADPRSLFAEMSAIRRGAEFAKTFQPVETLDVRNDRVRNNDLEKIFDCHTEGRGIWKWRHYFNIYQQHLSKFVGMDVNLLEIGVFSGGSLDMWQQYFGKQCKIYGVDIDEVCRAYEGAQTRIFIGDQEDRFFWKKFREEVKKLDVVIDDGGHKPDQQIVTLEEVLPYMNPGGVYICEDVHGTENEFTHYCVSLIKNLNAMDTHPDGGISANCLQRWIKGIYFYPFVTVIEKSERPVERLIADKRGTIWRPFNKPISEVRA